MFFNFSPYSLSVMLYKFYRHTMRRLGANLGKQVAQKVTGIESSPFRSSECNLCSNKIILLVSDNTYINKYMCPSMENPDLVHQETSNSQGRTYQGRPSKDSG